MPLLKRPTFKYVDVTAPGDYTQFTVGSIYHAPGTRYRARGQTFYLRQSSNPDPEGEQTYEGPGALTTNPYPVRVTGHDNIDTDTHWEGGRFLGDISLTADKLVWEEQEGGYVNSAAILHDGASPTTTCRTVKNVRIDRCWDGVRVTTETPPAPLGGHRHVLSGLWITDARDDAVENDSYASLTFTDSLLDGVYCGVSASGSGGWSSHAASDSMDLDGVLIRLKPYNYTLDGVPGTYSLAPFKLLSNSPGITFRNGVIALEEINRPSVVNDYWTTIWSHMTAAENSYICWLGDGSAPDLGTVPAGFTVQSGATAQNTWANARAAWIAAHPLIDRLDTD